MIYLEPCEVFAGLTFLHDESPRLPLEEVEFDPQCFVSVFHCAVNLRPDVPDATWPAVDESLRHRCAK